MNKKTIGCIDGNCNDGFGTYIEDCVSGLGDKYQSTYVGEFKSSKRHGQGKLIYYDETYVEEDEEEFVDIYEIAYLCI